MVWFGLDHRALLAFKTGGDGPGLVVTLKSSELFEKDKLTTNKPEPGLFSNLKAQLVQLQCSGRRPDTAIY